MEAALVAGLHGVAVFVALRVERHVEDGQLGDLHEGVEVDALRPETVVFLVSGAGIVERVAEGFCAALGEDGVQPLTDGVEVYVPDAVAEMALGFQVDILVQGVEVHVEPVSWQRRCHELSVGRVDVSSDGRNGGVVDFDAVGHFGPVVFLRGHDIHGLSYDGNGYERHQDGDEAVARHDFLIVELAHCSGI